MVIRSTFPRSLRPKERDIIESVLPVDRAGYRQLRDMVGKMVVLGQGRRGPGNIVLGFSSDSPDHTSPLPSVVAFGIVETTQDTFSVTVRECTGNQIDIEIVSSKEGEILDHFEEKRRWTYSTWMPGMPSPHSGESVREVRVDDAITLAISPEERRLWIHDRTTGMVHLIPVTNYYNALMTRKQVRDSKIVLDSHLLFTAVGSYSEDDLRNAFIMNNTVKHRVDIHPEPHRPPQRSLTTLALTLFRRKKQR